jgi:hypothetical protein
VKWGDLVESDRICVKGRWYIVQSQAPSGAIVHVRAKSEVTGAVGTFKRPAGDDVQCERGATGSVVDLFKVIFSGPTRPTEIITKGVGPMLGEREEDSE